MLIRSDIQLKGSNWKKALELFENFFPIANHPNYSLFVLGASIGIKYDKQLDFAGLNDDSDSIMSVPRTVLSRNNSEIDYLFQTAILVSKRVKFSLEDRMKLAFDNNCKIEFNKIEFLQSFANFGIGEFIKLATDEPIETMAKIKKFIDSTLKGHNPAINSLDDKYLDVKDIKF